MKFSTRHSVFAWILDLWLLNQLFEGFAKLWPAAVDVLPPIASPAIVFLVITLTSGYHFLWAKSTRFLSFGERVDGCFLTTAGKQWWNPYGTTRTYLFVALGYLLFVSTGKPQPPAGNPLLDLLFLGVAASSMIQLGRGWPWAILGVGAYRVWEWMS